MAKIHLLIGILLPIVGTELCHAGGISAPVSFPSAEVLPKNIRNFQYKGVYAKGNNRYNETGSTVSLGSSFETDISYRDLVNNEKTLQDQIFAEALLESVPGINLDDKMGKTTGVVSLAVNAHASIFAYGVTKQLTTAIVIPVIQSNLNVDVGAVSDASLQVLADYFSAPGQSLKSKLTTVRRKFENAVQNRLTENGYDKLENQEKTQLGDIQLISKYNFLNEENFKLTLLNGITLPTGKQADLDKLIDLGSGDEQFDISAGMAMDIKTSKNTLISTSLNYTIQLEQITKSRIYYEKENKITSQIDGKTKRDLGDIFQFAMAGKLLLSDHLSMQTAYTYQLKYEDRYKGNQFASKDYGYMSFETEQKMQALQIGINFDTITMYKRKEFMAPMELSLNYAKPFSGINVITDEMISGSISLYF